MAIAGLVLGIVSVALGALFIVAIFSFGNSAPIKPPHHLAWSKAGAADDELIFVAGHPGKTDRLNTVAQSLRTGRSSTT